MLIAQLIDLYCLVIVAAVLVSMTHMWRDHPVARFLRLVTEPVLGPARRMLPRVGGIDFSPAVVLVLLQLATRLL